MLFKDIVGETIDYFVSSHMVLTH